MPHKNPPRPGVESMNELWLRCSVSEGQFSDEFAVSAQTFDEGEFSLFVPDEFVELEGSLDEQQSVPGWVRVDVLDQKDDLVLVRLPRQTLENGRSVTVRRSQLETRPARQEA